MWACIKQRGRSRWPADRFAPLGSRCTPFCNGLIEQVYHTVSPHLLTICPLFWPRGLLCAAHLFDPLLVRHEWKAIRRSNYGKRPSAVLWSRQESTAQLQRMKSRLSSAAACAHGCLVWSGGRWPEVTGVSFRRSVIHTHVAVLHRSTSFPTLSP